MGEGGIGRKSQEGTVRLGKRKEIAALSKFS
jgi:hypothetical protein